MKLNGMLPESSRRSTGLLFVLSIGTEEQPTKKDKQSFTWIRNPSRRGASVVTFGIEETQEGSVRD